MSYKFLCPKHGPTYEERCPHCPQPQTSDETKAVQPVCDARELTEEELLTLNEKYGYFQHSDAQGDVSRAFADDVAKIVAAHSMLCINCKRPVQYSALRSDHLIHSHSGSHYCDEVKNRGPVAEIKEEKNK